GFASGSLSFQPTPRCRSASSRKNSATCWPASTRIAKKKSTCCRNRCCKKTAATTDRRRFEIRPTALTRSRRRARYYGGMNNAQIAAVLDEIADLLEFQAANPFRVRAYRNGARAVREMHESIAALAADGPKPLLG